MAQLTHQPLFLQVGEPHQALEWTTSQTAPLMTKLYYVILVWVHKISSLIVQITSSFFPLNRAVGKLLSLGELLSPYAYRLFVYTSVVCNQ